MSHTRDARSAAAAVESTLVELLRASRDADWALADSLAARLVDELAASSVAGERRHTLLAEAQQVVAEVMRAASTARRAVGSEARQLARGRKGSRRLRLNGAVGRVHAGRSGSGHNPGVPDATAIPLTMPAA